ncbi:hypothetical protein GN956_G18933 [Arapaima gigas]
MCWKKTRKTGIQRGLPGRLALDVPGMPGRQRRGCLHSDAMRPAAAATRDPRSPEDARDTVTVESRRALPVRRPWRTWL